MSVKGEEKLPLADELFENYQGTDNPIATCEDETELKHVTMLKTPIASIEVSQLTDQGQSGTAVASDSGHTGPRHDEGRSAGNVIRKKEDVPTKLLRCLIWILLPPLTRFKRTISVNILGLFWILVEITKIVLSTDYMFNVGLYRGQFSVLVNHGQVSLKHMLLRGWDASFETLPYPPAHGEFAVYNVEDLVQSIDYTVKELYNAEVAATGYFKKFSEDDIIISLRYFSVTENKYTHRFSDLKIKESRFSPKYGLTNRTDARGQTVYDYDIFRDLNAESLVSDFKRVLSVKVSFSLHSLKVYDENDRKDQAACIKITGNVTFDDRYHNGQVIVDLQTQTEKIPCGKTGYDVTERDSTCSFISTSRWAASVFLGISNIFECLAIFAWTCCRRFCCKINDRKEKNLTFQGRLVSIRPIAHTCESVATISGNVLTMIGIWIFNSKCGKPHTLADLDEAAVLDGVGLIVCYFTIVRFLKIYPNFSLLFNTIKMAAPGVLSFLVCVAVLFGGSFIFAYVVLGPYLVKFDERMKTSNTLFAISYGDEIYATMAILETGKAGNSGLITTSMYIFVYTYVLLFTVVVFNLLIALFNSAYEEVQKLNKEKKMESHTDSELIRESQDSESSEGHNMDSKETYDLYGLLKKWKIPCSGCCSSIELFV